MVHKSSYSFLPRLRFWLALLIFSFCALALPQLAEARQSTEQTPSQETSSNESELDSHKHYINKDGKTIHSPAKSKSGSIPDGASAQCRDGSYSFSTHRRGTCSHHGGVSQWL